MKIKTSPEKALKKLMHYCAYRDRSEKEVQDKLKEYGLKRDEEEEIIATLKADRFIDNRRFAENFARGKFFYNKWGKRKIRQYLQQHRISPELIREALKEIDDKDYRKTIRHLIEMKIKQYETKDKEQLLAKIYRYLEAKGYEPGEFYELLKDEIRKNTTA